ncbi:4-hydroxy-tetrahydrodipicolinate synthase [Alteribacillus bidgolensis]|uniref:4-hydroxy-tetrahydrodipicolinate synthase n=1 Tax=Alteribacillus bidgolensis TaxID=930129 RepID=A0A1G8NHZ7_9BACI|nr:4-hydroxy-tetrahydrodipicolinate synthase [Alteribacillus bidgolensis]SDI79717.1 4-hydroxy-tetrahydrodipicolinate synthase [Alteribacillus bidgolensis]
MKEVHLDGVITALLTAFDENGDVSENKLRQLSRHVLDAGVNGLFVLGTNGEFHVLNEEEKKLVAKASIEEANGEVPVIVGTGGNSTREVIERSKTMESLGADCLSVITPYFDPPSQEELYDYYRDVAEGVTIPTMIYNMPSRTNVSVDPETVARLSKIPNIIGIKDSSGDINLIKQYIEQTENFAVLSGADSLILDTLKAGGNGGVAATSNMVPELVVSIYDNWKNGKVEEAEKCQEALLPIRTLSKRATTPAVFKEAVCQLGIDIGAPRKPVHRVSGDIQEELREVLKQYEPYITT